MLTNSNNYLFGRTDDGIKVDDVILPKWAQTPEDFIRLNRSVRRKLGEEFINGFELFI